jgi:hypothetical protein
MYERKNERRRREGATLCLPVRGCVLVTSSYFLSFFSIFPVFFCVFVFVFVFVAAKEENAHAPLLFLHQFEKMTYT